MKITITLALGLMIGYLANPLISKTNQPETVISKTVVDYEILVESISQKSKDLSAEAHDQMLVHEVLTQNEIMEQQHVLSLHELLVQKQIREKALMKSMLSKLKTPEAQQALLNVSTPGYDENF